MIRNVVIHMISEQPMLADLKAMPTSADACLVCTNLRYHNGRKPIFTDALDSWFLIPLNMVRFVEVPRRASEQVEGLVPLPTPMIRDEDAEGYEPEPDEDLIRRVREA